MILMSLSSMKIIFHITVRIFTKDLWKCLYVIRTTFLFRLILTCGRNQWLKWSGEEDNGTWHCRLQRTGKKMRGNRLLWWWGSCRETKGLDDLSKNLSSLSWKMRDILWFIPSAYEMPRTVPKECNVRRSWKWSVTLMLSWKKTLIQWSRHSHGDLQTLAGKDEKKCRRL